MSGRDQNAKLQKKANQAQKVLQRAEQQTSSSKSSGLEQPMDGLGQLSPQQTADLQRTYGNGFVQQLAGQNKADGGDGETAVQREVGDGGKPVGGDVEQRIQRTRGGGSPLPKKTRQQMEGHIGADFSGVRVHHNQESDQLNRSLNAEAFTTGKDVYFREGGYNPDSKDGKQLIAHELTHVVQQGAAGRKPVQKKPTETIQRADEEEEKKKAKEEAKSKAQAGKNDANAKGRDGEAKAKEKEGQGNEKQGKQEKPEGKEKPAVPFAETDAEAAQEALLPEDGGETEEIDLEYMPLPSWDELALGTVQLKTTPTPGGAKKTGSNSGNINKNATDSNSTQNSGAASGTTKKVGELKLSETTQAEDGSSSSFSLSELDGDGKQVEMEIDRDKIAGDALKEGAWAGFKEGGTAAVQNLIIGQVTSRIPGGAGGGLLAAAQIAHDPDKWFKDNVIGIGDKAVAIGTAFKGISGEDTGWGKAAAILELVVSIMDFVTSITGLVSTILDIITAVCVIMIALAPVVPFGIMAWTPAVFGPIKAFIAPISRVLGMINNGIALIKLPLQGFITWFRYMDLKQTKADPQKLMEKQAKLKASMQGFVSSATETAAGKLADKAQSKMQKTAQKRQMRKDMRDIQTMESEIKSTPVTGKDVEANLAVKKEMLAEKKQAFYETHKSSYNTERKLKNAKESMSKTDYKEYKTNLRDTRQTNLESRIKQKQTEIDAEANPDKKQELESHKANMEAENGALKDKLGTVHMKKKRYEQAKAEGKGKQYIAKKVGQGALDVVTFGMRHRSEFAEIKAGKQGVKESWQGAKDESASWKAMSERMKNPDGSRVSSSPYAHAGRHFNSKKRFKDTQTEIDGLRVSKARQDMELDATTPGSAAHKRQQDYDNLRQKNQDVPKRRGELDSAVEQRDRLKQSVETSKQKRTEAEERVQKAEDAFEDARAKRSQALHMKGRNAQKARHNTAQEWKAAKAKLDQEKINLTRAGRRVDDTEAVVRNADHKVQQAKKAYDKAQADRDEARQLYTGSNDKWKQHRDNAKEFDNELNARKEKQEVYGKAASIHKDLKNTLKGSDAKGFHVGLAASDIGYKGFLAQLIEDGTGYNIQDWGEDWNDTEKLKARRDAMHERAVAMEQRGRQTQARLLRKTIAKLDKRIAYLTAQGKAKDSTAEFLKKYTKDGQGIITLAVSLPGLPTAGKYQDVDKGTDKGKEYQNDFEKDASDPDASVVDIKRDGTTYNIKDPAGGSILLPSSGKIEVKPHDVKMQTKFGIDGTVSKYAPGKKYTFKPKKHGAPTLDAAKRTVSVEVPYESPDFDKAYKPSTDSAIDADWSMLPDGKDGKTKYSAGQIVRISGTNFLGQTQRKEGSSQSYSVKFGTVASTAVSVTDTEIQAAVPVGLSTNPVAIKVGTPYSNGEQTLTGNFTYDKPTLSGATLPTTTTAGVTKLGSTINVAGENLQGTTQASLTNGTLTKTYGSSEITAKADGSSLTVKPPTEDGWHGKSVDVTLTSMGNTLTKVKAFTFPTPTAENSTVQTKPIQRAGGDDEEDETLNQQSQAEGAEVENAAASSSAQQNQEPTVQIGNQQVGNQPQPEPQQPEPEEPAALAPEMEQAAEPDVQDSPEAAMEEIGKEVAEGASTEATAEPAVEEEPAVVEGGEAVATEAVEETAVPDEEPPSADEAEAEGQADAEAEMEEDSEAEGAAPDSLYGGEAEQEPQELDVTFGATEDERDMAGEEPNALQALADQKEVEMMENMPSPPEDVLERIEGPRVAMGVLDVEQYSLAMQQQDIEAVKQDATAQHESMEGMRAIGQANQVAMDKHQQDADEKIGAQNEMKEASQEKQKEADSTSEQGGGINSMMSGLISPIMAAVGMGGSRKETKPEAGGNPNPAQAGSGTKKMDKATTDSAQLVKDTVPMKNQEIAQTTGAKQETTGMQKEVARTDAMLETKQDETAESIDTLGGLQEENDEKIANFEEQKEEQLNTQAEAYDEYAMWQEEVAMMREETFMQLEADLDSGTAEEALAA